MQVTFDTFRRHYFDSLRRTDRDLDTIGQLRIPETMALRIAWAADHGSVEFVDGHPGTASRILIAKLTNEALAFVGAARAGSLLGGWHHIRAIIETRATVHYLWLAQPDDTISRTERYVTYLRAVAWLRLQDARNANDVPRVTMMDEVARANGYAVTDDEVNEWQRIFGVKDIRAKPQLAQWHGPQDRMTQMVKACDPTGGAMREYWTCSQATHPSPLGGRLGSDQLKTIGFDMLLLQSAVDAAAVHLYGAVQAFDKALGWDLRSILRDDLRALGRVRELQR